MRIPIDISKLTDSPYTPLLKDAFILENDDLVNQLVQAIQNSNPSAYLISGYRGIGKTSFINRVKEKLVSNTVFITISLARYDGNAKLIKKIIRHLYLSFESLSIKDKPELNQLRLDLGLLYDRTFYEVTNQEKNVDTVELEDINAVELDIKKIIQILFVVFAGLNIGLNFSSNVVFQYILFLLSIVWIAVTSLKVKLTKTTKNNVSNESSRKTLYDDEIAEHHLYRLLEELKIANVPVIIVFDELDKLATTKEIDAVINEQKSLLLSGYANFLVVAGQGLYYQVVKAAQLDDAIISSIFSKTIHIGFMGYSSLKKFCLGVSKDQSYTKNGLYNHFFDYLIADASRVPRKLSNLIKANVVWENNIAFLHIDEGKADFYKKESELLAITTKVADGDLPGITGNEVLLDFFTAQIHLWLNSIKYLKSIEFSITDIIQEKKYHSDEYPLIYVGQLHSICELFFQRLVDSNILKSRVHDGSLMYSWLATESENVGSDISQLKNSDFVQEFVELEHYVRGIYTELIEEDKTHISTLPLAQMIHNLTTQGIVKPSWHYSNILSRITETRNKVVHGLSVTSEDLNTIQNSRFDIGRVKGELIESYTFYIVRKHLVDYDVQNSNVGGFDFIARLNNYSIVFDVKYMQYGRHDGRNVHDIIDKFTNYLQTTSTNGYYVLFFYQPNGRKSYDEFYAKFFETIKASVPALSDRFYLFYTSEYRGDTNSGGLELFLDQVTSKIASSQLQPEPDKVDFVDFPNASDVIVEKSKRDWPNDFSMQMHQVKQQQQAVADLIAHKPDSVPENIFRKIRSKASEDWPEDYVMRLHQEKDQVQSYLGLNGK